MNKTKRKIFETSMKLFAEKGYDATSIEDINCNSRSSKRGHYTIIFQVKKKYLIF